MNKTKQRKFMNQNRVKEIIRPDTWCSNHINCFRASFNTENYHYNNKRKPESEEHIRTKFERWLHWRSKQFDVLVEGRLINNLRPDLIVWNENEMFIEEIAESEKEASLIKKKQKYPLPLFIHKRNKK